MLVFPHVQDLPDDGSRQKEVYAAAGLALFHAQVWERGMINLALIMRRDGGKIATPEEWDKHEDKLSSLTAGSLRNLIEKEKLAPLDTLELWQKALSSRNYLVHRFFYTHSIAAMTTAGLQIMLDELAEMIQRFQIADEMTGSVVEQVTARWGITEDSIHEMQKQLVKDYLKSH